MASSPPSSLLTSPTLSSTPAFPSLSSASLPPSDITLAGILTELSLCHHRNQQVAHQLQQLTQQHRQTTELILPTLSSLSSTLPPVTQSAAALNSILSNSALSASALSSQVRILDLTQSRLLAALQRTAALLDLKNTIATVEKEREKGAWDVCVRELHRVLYCARTIQDRQYERLRELEEELRAELEALMRRREEDGQWKEVVTYARLLPYLDRTFVGLSAACLAVRQLLHSALTSKAITLSSQPPQSVLPFTSLLTGILDQVALCLKQWMQQLQLSFGAGTQLRLLQEVTAECDQEVAPILRQFMQDRRVAALVREVKQAQLRLGLLKKAAGGGAAAAAGSGRGGSEGEVDARTLDALLTEMAFLSREVDQFDANMRSLAKQAEESLQRGIEQEERQMQLMQQPQTDDEITAANSLPSPSSSSASASVSPASSPPKLSLYYHLSAVQAAMAQSAYGASLRATSAVREACQELLGHYIGLEEHYMLLNVDKAMRIDVHEGGGDEQQEEDEEEEREDEERRRSRESREREGVSSRVQAISDKLTHNIASNISNINLAIQATSGIGILMSGAAAGGAAAGQAASASSSSLPSVSPTFLRRFRTTLTSTLVDDTFFILKKCTERAFSTASAQAACALVNHINSLLQREYYEQLESVLVEYERKYTPQQKRPVFVSAAAGESRASNIVSLLTSAAQTGQVANVQQKKLNDDERLLLSVNNLQLSMEHISMLRQHLQAEFQETRREAAGGAATAAADARTEEMLRACLDELTVTQQRFASLHSKAVQLLLNILTVRLKPHFTAFLSASYELSEHEYMEQEQTAAADVLVSQLTDCVQRTILPLRSALTERNHVALLSALTAYLAAKLEQLVMRKRFSFWGGLQLDREVRLLSGWLAGQRGAEEVGVRDKMMRLVQLCSVLQVERVSEMKDLWGEGGEGGMWRLHEGEVRKALSLRTEFTARDIAALKL